MKTIDITYRFEAREAPARLQPPGSDAALLRLDEGNRAFAALLDGLPDGNGVEQRLVLVDPHDVGLLQGDATAPSQHPFAAILGCSDARVPVELIFNEGPNDLFVIRVAGNGLGTEVLDSLKYAVEHLADSLKLIVEASTVTNAALAAYSIQQEFGAGDPSKLRTAYGVYLLETREVWAPRLGNTKGTGLATPPNDPAGFVELGDAIVKSERIASLIKLEK